MSCVGDCCSCVHLGVEEWEAVDGVVGDGVVGGGGDDESIVFKGVVVEGLLFCVLDYHALVGVVLEVIVYEVVLVAAEIYVDAGGGV